MGGIYEKGIVSCYEKQSPKRTGGPSGGGVKEQRFIRFMKKSLLSVCTLVLTVSLTACGTKFDGSRTGNDSEFIMEYRVLNTTDMQDLIAESGDTISGKIIVNKGSLSIKIQQDEEEPIYESSGISVSNEFDVEIDESGTYTVEVTGKGAEGSVSFLVE